MHCDANNGIKWIMHCVANNGIEWIMHHGVRWEIVMLWNELQYALWCLPINNKDKVHKKMFTQIELTVY